MSYCHERVLFVLFRGLLGGHSMALMLKEEGHHMRWYQDELLHMAKDLGLRLLPAFNTSSGLPYPRVRMGSGFDAAT